MRRTPRKYASAFKSRVPARPSAGSSHAAFFGDDGGLGPGSIEVNRDGIKLKEPKRPSPAFRKDTGGRFHNVGGPRRDGGQWPEHDSPSSRDEWGDRRAARGGESVHRFESESDVSPIHALSASAWAACASVCLASQDSQSISRRGARAEVSPRMNLGYTMYVLRMVTLYIWAAINLRRSALF